MSIQLDKIPSYSHKGLKVYTFPKNEQFQIDDDHFFTTLYETLNDDVDDISFTGSFGNSLNFSPNIQSQISPTRIELPTPKISVDFVDKDYNENEITKLLYYKKKHCEAQTNVSLVDEKFLLDNSNGITTVKTKDMNIGTDKVIMQNKCCEVDHPILTNQFVLTDSIYILNENEVDEWKESLNNLESEKNRLQNLLDEKYVNQTTKSQTLSTSVQTNKSAIVSTSCQASTNNIDANSQTIIHTEDFSVQHDVTIEMSKLDDEDELNERKLLELTLQQKQLAWERELRVKIGEIEQLECQISDVELKNRDVQQQNKNIQQDLLYLSQQISDKDKLISDLEAIRNDSNKFKKFMDVEIQAGDEDAIQNLRQQLEAAKLKERNLLSQIEELLRKDTMVKNISSSNDEDKLKYDQLKLKFDDIQVSNNHLKLSLFQTESNIENLNKILQQKDELLRNLLTTNSSNKNIFNKENVSPLQSINIKDQDLENFDDEKSTNQYMIKKRLPMKSITEVGRTKNKFSQLRLYNDLKNEYLNKTFSNYQQNINSNILPSCPSNLRCIRQKNGKISLAWNPQHSQTVFKYQININDARTISIDNTGSGKYDLILNRSELNSQLLSLNLRAIDSKGFSSDASHLIIKNSIMPSVARSRSTNDLSNMALPKFDLQARRLCIAVYDYKPSILKSGIGEISELKFDTGDYIETFGSHRPDGFYYGRLRGSEVIGLVPKHFIEEIRQLQIPYLKT